MKYTENIEVLLNYDPNEFVLECKQITRTYNVNGSKERFIKWLNDNGYYTSTNLHEYHKIYMKDGDRWKHTIDLNSRA